MKKILNLLFLFLGFLAVGLGTVGIVLPLLPTTPLYFLACFCFAKGSLRFHKWFTNTRLYKKYLENFIRTRAMTVRAKLSICLPVSMIMIGSIIFIPSWIMRVTVICLLLFKWWYFAFRIRTIPSKSAFRQTTQNNIKN